MKTNKQTKKKPKTTQPKVSRRKEVIKIRVEISEIKNRKKQRSMKLCYFLQKINKIDKFLARLRKKERRQINQKPKMKHYTDTTEI